MLNNKILTYRKLKRLGGILLLLMLASSCTITKNVPKGKYLLVKNKIKIKNREIDKQDLKSYMKQAPNKRVLGIRFHLMLYNMANKKKQKGISNWLRKIGEPPVIYDDFQTSKSVAQLDLYLKNKGFYGSKIKDTVIYRRKKARAFYYIKTQKPYKINKLSYVFEDSTIMPFIYRDTLGCLIKRGKKFDVSSLKKERQRIERNLKNKGFFDFSRNYIHYNLDSTVGDKKVDVFMKVKPQQVVRNNIASSTHHKRYTIRDVYIYPNFKQEKNTLTTELFKDVVYKQIHFLCDKSYHIKEEVLYKANYIKPGELYNLTNYEKTLRHLSNLRLYKFINIRYTKHNGGNEGIDSLDCYIYLTPLKKQSYSIESEVTSSSGNIGLAGSLTYQHKNLLGGAELLGIKFKGAMETIGETKVRKLDNTLELGGEISLKTPKFILPFKLENFFKNYSPKTQFSFAYNYQNRPYYNRHVTNGVFGYLWKGNRNITHTVNPLEISFVDIRFIDSTWYENDIKGTYQENSFQDHMVTVSSYNLTFTDQNEKKDNNFIFLNFNLQVAGNILTLSNTILERKTYNGSYNFLQNKYAQFVRSDINISYHNYINNANQMAYRIYAGLGIPYGNSDALPFEKKFFSGGANSIRAWQSRSLGPGSYYQNINNNFPNQMGDIKLEANIEYRFKLFWIIEGALFIDAGNIWAMSRENPYACFDLDDFHKEIAVGTGFGTRFDLRFFIFRFDVGIKLRNPQANKDHHWIPGNRPFYESDVQYNIGIGYPF